MLSLLFVSVSIGEPVNARRSCQTISAKNETIAVEKNNLMPIIVIMYLFYERKTKISNSYTLCIHIFIYDFNVKQNEQLFNLIHAIATHPHKHTSTYTHTHTQRIQINLTHFLYHMKKTKKKH